MQKIYETIEVDLTEDMAQKLCNLGLELINEDKNALIEYAAVKVLEQAIEHPEELKRLAEKYREEHKDEICPKCDFLMDKKEISGTAEEAFICSNCNYKS